VNRDGAHNYTYDTLNRLIEAVNPLPSNPQETYVYDPVGNRNNSNQNGVSTFNQANQLLEDANFTYQYDNNGNLTRKTPKTSGPFTSYEYDAENKLVRVVTNGTTINYKYDGLGRRVEKEVINVTTKVTRYIYDNEDILLELDGSNNIVARYTHGPGIDEPLIVEKTGASFFYHVDGLGSISEITDSAGVIKQRYTYSSFGEIESQVDPNFIQPYTFTAREYDSETVQYFYRARAYAAATGRFLQEDPLSFLAGINFYAYVWNNPVRYIDPFGERAFCGSGPSSILIPDSWYGKYDFSSACSKHDDCYGACGKSKAACDQDFYRNMLKECSKLTGYWLSDCVSTAQTYYYAVRKFGGGPFKQAQIDCRCNE